MIRDYAKVFRNKRCRTLLLALLSLSLVVFAAPAKPAHASTLEPTTLYCTSVSYNLGRSYSGTHENTHASDNVYHWSYGRLFRFYEPGIGWIFYYVLDVVYTFNIGSFERLQVTKVEVEGEARTNYASTSGETVDLEIFNYRTNSWQPCGSFVGSTSDVVLSWSDTVDPLDFIDTAGNMKLRWFFGAQDFSRLGIDFQCIKLTIRHWTFMVYLDADNNLESAGIDDFLEMASVGSTLEVSVVVQIDRNPNWIEFYGYDSRFGNWTGCKRFYVSKDMEPWPENAVQDLGEVNMGSNITLADFTEWAMNNYVAMRYCLVLWDHGNGFQYVCVDETSDYDYLDMIELKYALDTVKSETGKIIDLIGFDACLMQMTEVAYQIRNYGTVMVASEETMPLDGWPYDTVLGNLTDAPDMEAAEFGEKIVDAYEDFWTPTHYVYYDLNGEEAYIPIVKLTLSAINLTRMNDLAVWLDDFAIRLYNALSDPTLNASIRECRAKAQEYMTEYDPSHRYYVDLYNFTRLVYEHPNITDVIKDRAWNLMDAINKTVTSEWHDYGAYAYYIRNLRVREVWMWGCPGSHGISIYFPDDPNDYFRSPYEALDFSNEHFCWPNFLKEYLGLPL